jgi:hypothetical protein
MVGRRFDRLASRGDRVARFRDKGRNQLDRWWPRHKSGGRHELFQAGRTWLGWLDEAQDSVLIDRSQVAIHPVMKSNTPTGEVKAYRQGRQGDDVAKQADRMVIGHSPPVGEMDLLVGLGQGKPGAVGRAGLGWWLSEALVETGQVAGQDGIGLDGIGRPGRQ